MVLCICKSDITLRNCVWYTYPNQVSQSFSGKYVEQMVYIEFEILFKVDVFMLCSLLNVININKVMNEGVTIICKKVIPSTMQRHAKQ